MAWLKGCGYGLVKKGMVAMPCLMALPVIAGQIHGHDDDDEEQKQHRFI